MTSWITSVLLGAIALWAVPGQAQSIVVGAVVSQTGAQAAAAAGYRKALLLWEAQVNARGGLLGRPVELRLRDDGSQAVRARDEYRKLLDESQLLIGPYGSAATLMGAAVAESAQRVMLNGGGPARTVHKRSPRYLFQSTLPYASYGEGALALAQQQGLTRLFILGRDDPRSGDMAEATAELARQQGFSVLQVHSYPAGNADFAPQVAAARAAQAEAWIAFGEVREAAQMVRSLKSLGYAPPLVFLRAAAEPAFIALVGQDAEFSLGAIEYDASLGTPGNEAFVKAFRAKWSDHPGPAAAEGYAVASVLEAAVRRAGTLDQDALRAALAGLEVPTVLGTYKVDRSNGTQIGIKAPVTQIRRGVPVVVWPPGLQAQGALLPYPQWHERSLLK